MHLPQREHYAYHSRYCEENIWLLCQQAEFADSEVIFMAAQAECFPILCQRAAEASDEPLFWDYHVVLLWHSAEQPYLLDFDSTLAFCTPLSEYFTASFYPEYWVKPNYRPLFRVIPSAFYRQHFFSDRRHMQTKRGWHAPPPPWPPISATQSNLPKFTNMADHEYGRVLTATQLLQTYTKPQNKENVA